MISKEEAMTCGMFYHVWFRNVDGTALRARANGKCKTWKRSLGRWRLPIKHGLRDCGYLTPSNARLWLIYDPTDADRIWKSTKLSCEAPWQVVRDWLLDNDRANDAERFGIEMLRREKDANPAVDSQALEF